MAVWIDGKALAAGIKAQVREEAAALPLRPVLAVVLVGEDPASQIYVRGKERDCAECGIKSIVHRLPASAAQAELLSILAGLNGDAGTDGILVQLPLPRGLDQRQILEAIRPDKDVDCFHPLNVGKMTLGREGFRPCTPAGVMEMLKAYDIPVQGKRCAVIGRSSLVGQPLASLLTQADGTVTLCHSRTENLAEHTRQADILVSAVGRPGLVTGDMVKEGAAVIDVAINRGEDGKLRGDVDFEAVEKKAAFITPVPGGVGPMTRAMLMRSVLYAARLHQGQAV
ncbi:MAG: bifunctional methylenetetrahydrofolate dehydrogenase/methenyltetrahydrofolate cyclohydrolase FolD [Oscillibacter sp.]|jgi:methylenetetrahydrofolate dehydrogenase (NADP+)/methenyltetrahydrofolate cyclohydrolase|nr:bifunctional methylenetetrahydrofolate dehydrogenase/methenyltetrahydrofolate cyclohydrolase FolD [Oscillibacter sp.]